MKKYICIKKIYGVDIGEICIVVNTKVDFRKMVKYRYFLDIVIVEEEEKFELGVKSDGTLYRQYLFTEKNIGGCIDISLKDWRDISLKDFNEHFISLAEWREKQINSILED